MKNLKKRVAALNKENVNLLQRLLCSCSQAERLKLLVSDTVGLTDACLAYTAKTKTDILTLTLRLLGEDPETFSPETREVMDRWRSEAEKLLNGEKT